jgi:hypothetical protein
VSEGVNHGENHQVVGEEHELVVWDVLAVGRGFLWAGGGGAHLLVMNISSQAADARRDTYGIESTVGRCWHGWLLKTWQTFLLPW